jgi:hypothetical protein
MCADAIWASTALDIAWVVGAVVVALAGADCMDGFGAPD